MLFHLSAFNYMQGFFLPMSTVRCLHTAIRPVLAVQCLNASLRIPAAPFHKSVLLEIRSTHDKSKARGVSAIRRRFKKPLSVSKLPLPEPVVQEGNSTVTVDSDHGLYGFFGKDGKVLPTPEEDFKHGARPLATSIERGQHD